MPFEQKTVDSALSSIAKKVDKTDKSTDLNEDEKALIDEQEGGGKEDQFLDTQIGREGKNLRDIWHPGMSVEENVEGKYEIETQEELDFRERAVRDAVRETAAEIKNTHPEVTEYLIWGWINSDTILETAETLINQNKAKGENWKEIWNKEVKSPQNTLLVKKTLVNFGFKIDNMDNNYDPQTEEAVKKLQGDLNEFIKQNWEFFENSNIDKETLTGSKIGVEDGLKGWKTTFTEIDWLETTSPPPAPKETPAPQPEAPQLKSQKEEVSKFPSGAMFVTHPNRKGNYTLVGVNGEKIAKGSDTRYYRLHPDILHALSNYHLHRDPKDTEGKEMRSQAKKSVKDNIENLIQVYAEGGTWEMSGLNKMRKTAKVVKGERYKNIKKHHRNLNKTINKFLKKGNKQSPEELLASLKSDLKEILKYDYGHMNVANIDEKIRYIKAAEEYEDLEYKGFSEEIQKTIPGDTVEFTQEINSPKSSKENQADTGQTATEENPETFKKQIYTLDTKNPNINAQLEVIADNELLVKVLKKEKGEERKAYKINFKLHGEDEKYTKFTNLETGELELHAAKGDEELLPTKHNLTKLIEEEDKKNGEALAEKIEEKPKIVEKKPLHEIKKGKVISEGTEKDQKLYVKDEDAGKYYFIEQVEDKLMATEMQKDFAPKDPKEIGEVTENKYKASDTSSLSEGSKKLMENLTIPPQQAEAPKQSEDKKEA